MEWYDGWIKMVEENFEVVKSYPRHDQRLLKAFGSVFQKNDENRM